MQMNKKGFIGYEYIVMFFFFLIAFTFIILVTDIGRVEVFNPMHNYVINLTSNQSGNTSIYYTKSAETWDTLGDLTLPYNLILIFVTAFLIIVSLVDASKQNKKNIYNLLFGTLGGLIFIIYLIHLFLISIIEYFEIQIINYMFADLINTYLPFYNYILDIWGIFILFWVLGMALSNHLFGQEVTQ